MDIHVSGAGAYLAAESSATGGYIPPTTISIDGDAYLQLLNRVIVGMTMLDGTLVRPRWQRDPVPAPPIDTPWCAYGVMNTTRDASAVTLPDGTLIRNVRDEVMFSFYGPGGEGLAAIVMDGLEVCQNRDQLRDAGIGYIGIDSSRPANELINDQWLERWDLTILLSREVRRNYSILPLVSASGVIMANGPDPAITVPFQEQ